MKNRKQNHLLQVLSIAALLLIGGQNAFAQALTATLVTDKGVIELELNERAAPTTVANFVNLAQRGFYDGLTFHRVERNFVIQGGDPRGNGTGGPGYQFTGEVLLKHTRPGTLSMANSGVGTDGSQFFLTLVPTPHLDGKHSVFGRITSGLQTIYKINRSDVIRSITIHGDTAALKARKKADLDRWNAILDREFPDLRPAQP
ncbi:MAG: peptidylprolyl isomerase [Gammaproteobacteria bacterium]|nr:peptidylprolyl isomerase [Pseudomonadales bacterium]MCP5331189.1 peptidylprolyl isomerase [Pseudomonadales bacterium]